MDPLANVPSAVLGWADARRFFGDYSRGLGLGDVHGAQGDGEVSITAIEVSCHSPRAATHIGPGLHLT